MRKWIPLLVFLLASCGAKEEPHSSVFSITSDESSTDIVYSLPPEDHEKIPLYQEGNVPYEGGEGHRYAFLTPYFAPNPTGQAVLVIPGGGYTHLSNSTPSASSKFGGSDNEGNQKEASAIAPYYNQIGVSVFVLNYRTTIVDPELDYHALVSDILRGIRVLSSHSDEYHFDALALQGYSAGGHLALMAIEHPDFQIDDPNYSLDAIDDLPISIDSLILGYPVVSFLDGYTHASTRRVFTGNKKDLYESFSAELGVDEDFPATYLFHEEKDPTVPIAGSRKLAEALEFFDIPRRFDVFADEASEETPLHGFGVTSDLPEAMEWMVHATDFLRERRG